MDTQQQFQQEEEELKKDRIRFALGMSDFFAVVLGVAAILVMVLLLFSLVGWLKQDLGTMLTLKR